MVPDRKLDKAKCKQDGPFIESYSLGILKELYEPLQWPNQNEVFYLAIFDTGVQILIPRALISVFVFRAPENIPMELRCLACNGVGIFYRKELQIRRPCGCCDATGLRPI